MRTRTSLAAAAMAAILTTTSVVPASAQPANNGEVNASSTKDDKENKDAASGSSTGCIATGLAMGLPLLLLLPAGLATSLKIPGAEQLNTQIQRQIGMLNPQLAKQFEEQKQTLGAVAGVAGAALGIAGAVYLAQNCGDAKTDDAAGSSTDGSSDEGSSEEANTLPPITVETEQSYDVDGTFDLYVTAVALAGTSGDIISVKGLPKGITYNPEKKEISGSTNVDKFTITINVKADEGIQPVIVNFRVNK